MLKQQNGHQSIDSITNDDSAYEECAKGNVPLFDALQELCDNNVKYFGKDDSPNGIRLHAAFRSLTEHIDGARDKVQQIQGFAHEYDFDENTPGNGYRSFIIVVDCCVKHSLKLCRSVMENRNSILFRKALYMKEMESCSHLLASLTVCLDHLLTLHSWSSAGSLFTDQGHTAEELLSHGGAINQYCFYGRCIGFQFCKSMRSALKFICSCMAGFSEGFYSDRGKLAKTTSSMWTSGKFLLDPDLRARRIVNLSQNSDVHFCKAFWFLAESEMMAKVPGIVGTTVKVNKVIKIPPEPLQAPHRQTGQLIDIPIPTSHTGTGPVMARLLCYTNRKGMMGDNAAGPLKCGNSPVPAKGLLLHCHGGGFVAQSSKSHEIYLREWAVALNMPILSIDYSLAPEAPFPRALEEVFYAYCWALNNCEFLGTTCEKVIMAGDSAGANLSIACALKCIDMGVRIPDGILLLYCPTLINFVVSPARLLCLMDPLLPFSFMMGCLKAYTTSPGENGAAEGQQRKEVQLNSISRIKSKTHQPFSSSTASTGSSDKQLRTVLENGMVIMNQQGSVDVIERAEEALEVDIPKNEEGSGGDGPENDIVEHSNSMDLSTMADEGARSEGFSGDTLASAVSLNSGATTQSNTEAPTPDGSNGVSFEEDSQPIRSRHSFVTAKLVNGKDKLHHDLVDDNDMNLDDELRNDPLTHYVLDTNLDPMARDGDLLLMEETKSEDNILFDISQEAVTHALKTGTTKEEEEVGEEEAATAAAVAAERARIRASLDSMEEARSPSEEFKFEVPQNPYISPYYASDEVLRQLPPVKIITLQLDPCLDDCVMFAKRLKAVKNPVTMDILSGLPHGFLNFVSLSKDAMDGSKLCIKRMAELFNTATDGDECNQMD